MFGFISKREKEARREKGQIVGRQWAANRANHDDLVRLGNILVEGRYGWEGEILAFYVENVEAGGDLSIAYLRARAADDLSETYIQGFVAGVSAAIDEKEGFVGAGSHGVIGVAERASGKVSGQ